MDAQVESAAAVPGTTFDIELRLFIEAIYLKYHYDFRGYAVASLKRRLATAMTRFHCETLTQLQDKLLHDHTTFPALLDFLTVQVSEMFRDPAYYLALREEVVPLLRTYPSLKVWVAGCSAGEEAYSLAILLRGRHARSPPSTPTTQHERSRRPSADLRWNRWPLHAEQQAVAGEPRFGALHRAMAARCSTRR